MQEHAVEPGAAAAPGRKQFVAHRIVNDANLDLARGDIGDRDAEMRHAAREVRRAIDRIDDPGAAALAGGTSLALFANEAVAWKFREHPLRDDRLRLPVDLGQKVVRTLESDRE